MNKIIIIVMSIFGLSLASQYNVLVRDRYEYGADSVVFFDSSMNKYGKFVYLRGVNQVKELNVNNNDTTTYVLNSFGKPIKIFNKSSYAKYEYLNQRLANACFSSDSSFTNCDYGQSIFEYLTNLTYKITITTPSDTVVKFISCNDSGDVVSIFPIKSTSGKDAIDSVSYDYITGKVVAKQSYLDRNVATESDYYFVNGNLTRMNNLGSNGRITAIIQFYYSNSSIIKSVLFNSHKTQINKLAAKTFMLNGRLLSNPNINSRSIVTKNGKLQNSTNR